eukprot:m.267019 g.267019  ORF g.267019 m.267019 type:complete len:350 (-) comp16241_c0_seq2:1940-2989(-)
MFMFTHDMFGYLKFKLKQQVEYFLIGARASVMCGREHILPWYLVTGLMILQLADETIFSVAFGPQPDCPLQASGKSGNVNIPGNMIVVPKGCGCSADVKNTLVVPAHVRGFEDNAFDGCKFKHVIMENNITYLPAKMFFSLPKLETIILPPNLITIGNETFYFTSLTTIKLPESLREIGAGAFSTTTLSNIVIPNLVTDIGVFAFAYTKMTMITLPKNLKVIPDYFLFSVGALETIILPDSITTINTRTLTRTDLKSLVLPNSLTHLGVETLAFTNIASVTFPNSMKEIWDRAFSGCNQLVSVTWPPIDICKNIAVGSGVFENTGCPPGVFQNCVNISNCQNPHESQAL